MATPSSTFDDWKSSNPTLFPFLEIEPLSQSSNPRPIHQKLVSRLSAHVRKLTEALTIATRNREKIEQTIKHTPRVIGLTFDNSEDNLRVRIAGFLRVKIDNLGLKSIQLKCQDIELKKSQCEVITQLLNGPQIPQSSIVSVKESFFDLPTTNTEIERKIKQLQRLRKQTVSELNLLPQPKWSEGLDAFLMSLIEKGVHKMSPEMLYFEPLPEEVSLSRYLFRTHSKEGRAIDNFIARNADSKFKDFRTNIIPFCLGLIPRTAEKTEQIQTAGLLIFYRAIMDRIVHICFRTFKESDEYTNVRQKLVQRTVESILCPPEIKPLCDPSTNWFTGFRNDPRYAIAVELMTQLSFETNAVGICEILSRAVSAIHKAAIGNRLRKDPEPADLQKLLAFDDLFALSVACVVVSDIPDLERLAMMVRLFTPRVCFSQLFDYAGANLEAFYGWYRDQLFDVGES
jgi:hypothetical protein